MTNILKIAEGLNITTPTAPKMTVKKAVFNSLKTPDYRMITTKCFDNTSTLLNPRIDSIEFVDKNGIKASYASKRFQNGNRFEVYRFSDEIVKVLKDKFGQIRGFKSTKADNANLNQEKIYENAKEAIRNKTHYFFA